MQAFQQGAEVHLSRIEKLLDPRAKLTLVVRMPWLGDGDIVLTMDDLSEVEAAIARFRKTGDRSAAKQPQDNDHE